MQKWQAVTRGAQILCTLLGAVCVALVLFWGLYHLDNKYTRQGSQPIGGLWYLEEADLEGRPLYPVYEWEYHPGVLLLPGDFDMSFSPVPRQYLYLGQYGNLAAGQVKSSPHGSASYRLKVLLPQESRVYSLWMPDIYCTYRLYVNGQLLMSMGSPESEGYEARLGERLVSFEAGGEADILIAVSSRSFITSGMTHPPAFGTQAVVSRAFDTAVIIRTLACTVALLLALMFFYIRWSAGYRRGGLYGGLCLCFLGYGGIPLVRILFTLGLQPFAALYLGCYYAMFLLILLLQMDLYGLPARLRRGCLVVGLGIALLAMGVSLLPQPGQWQIRFFSGVSEAYKWAMVLAMVVFAVLALKKAVPFSIPLLFAVIFFGGSLFMDRLLPLYEPILGGWFPETAGFVVMCLLGWLLWSDMVRSLRENMLYSQALAQADRNLEMLREHYETLDAQTEVMRAAYHDFRQQRILIQNYADKGELEPLRVFLQEYQQSLPTDRTIWYTKNVAVNVVTRYYAGLCVQEGIDFCARYDIATRLSLSDAEINILLGNLLENAIEACRLEQEGGRWISITGTQQGTRVSFIVENSCSTPSKPKGALYKSRKLGGGQGLKSIRKTAEQAGGMAAFTTEAGIFRAMVIFETDGEIEEL